MITESLIITGSRFDCHYIVDSLVTGTKIKVFRSGVRIDVFDRIFLCHEIYKNFKASNMAYIVWSDRNMIYEKRLETFKFQTLSDKVQVLRNT